MGWKCAALNKTVLQLHVPWSLKLNYYILMYCEECLATHLLLRNICLCLIFNIIQMSDRDVWKQACEVA